MQAQSQLNQDPNEGNTLTSYWLAQHSAAFTMHLKDISLRMDEKDPKHAQLRSFIKTYLGSVEKLEKELVDIELGRKEENKSEIAQLERKVEILNKDVDNLTAKLIQNKLDLITAKEKKNELNKTFLRYMSSIYNPVVESINKTITTSSKINRTLKNYNQTQQTSVQVAGKILEENRVLVKDLINLQTKKNKQTMTKKAELIEQITTLFQRYNEYDGNLFFQDNKRYEDTSETLADIVNAEKKAEELDIEIKELEKNHNRKLGNITYYQYGLDMMQKTDPKDDDDFSTESSNGVDIQRTNSLVIETNTQVTFHQEKPHPYARPILAVWFFILVISAFALTIS